MGASANPSRSLQDGAAYLRRIQPADGGWRGVASPDQDTFSHAREHPTIFFTALMLTCLHAIPGLAVARRRAASWLLSHRSDQWSWNYWVRGPEARGYRVYPDDLDDTACALAALWHYDPTLIDGRVQARLTQHLIAIEIAPGGPYATWLVGREAPVVWRDIDIAVNANIGYVLALQQVQLSGLEQYIATALTRHKLTSPYYVGQTPVLYFLARWYRGEAQTTLDRLVNEQLNLSVMEGSVLGQAMSVTAALHLGIDTARVEPIIRTIIEQQRPDGSWPAAALYREPPVQGTAQYAGSVPLTTAFCLEALMAYRQACRRRLSALPRTSQVIFDYVEERGADIKQPDLRRYYGQCVRRLSSVDRDNQISGTATAVALACHAAVNSDTLLHLNVASIQGWIAYTIYDDFLDGEGKPHLLGVANMALRQAVASFRAALPHERVFQQLVATTLESVDGANTWEIVHARAPVARGVVKPKQLVDYGQYVQLAERSWGHMLAACGVLVAAGYATDSQEVQQVQHFFHHYLIARQLNDDAHDWEDDLAHGRLTAVVSLLLRGLGLGSKRIVLAKQQAALRQYFWDQTILEVAEIVQQHIKQARMALAECSALRDTAQMDAWLNRVEQSTQQALAGRQQVQEFMETYTGPEVT